MKNVEEILRKTAIRALDILLTRAYEDDLRNKIIALQECACTASCDEIRRIADEVSEIKKKLKGSL